MAFLAGPNRGLAPSLYSMRRVASADRRMTRTRTGRVAAHPDPERCSRKQRNETRQNTLQIPGCHLGLPRPTRRDPTVRGKA
jgi:hypothetical protein